jgi:xyloglucan-specific endo-beta-1,4-glucanase
MKTSFVLAGLASFASADQKLCGQEQTFQKDGYIINNNAYNQGLSQGSQCTFIDSVSNKGVKWHTTWQWSGADEQVISYANSGLALSDGDKKLLSDIHSMPTSVTWSYENTKNIVADVSYDLFTAKDHHHRTSSGDFELMIW